MPEIFLISSQMPDRCVRSVCLMMRCSSEHIIEGDVALVEKQPLTPRAAILSRL